MLFLIFTLIIQVSFIGHFVKVVNEYAHRADREDYNKAWVITHFKLQAKICNQKMETIVAFFNYKWIKNIWISILFLCKKNTAINNKNQVAYRR